MSNVFDYFSWIAILNVTFNDLLTTSRNAVRATREEATALSDTVIRIFVSNATMLPTSGASRYVPTALETGRVWDSTPRTAPYSLKATYPRFLSASCSLCR